VTYPDYSNAYAGVVPGGIKAYAHRGGSWQLSTIYAHRNGSWRPVTVWRLPAVGAPADVHGTMEAVFGFGAAMDAAPTVTGSMSASFGFGAQINGDVTNDVLGSMSASFGFNATMAGTAVPPVQSGTTVIFISDLLASGETLDNPVDNSVHLQNCITRLVKRTGGTAASTTAITTPHVTVDWENRYVLAERGVECPKGGDMLTPTGGTLGHPCHNWPGGMKWRNGGIIQNLDDGFAGSSGTTPWDYKGTTTTADVTVPADTSTTFSVPVVTTNAPADFTDVNHVIRIGDKDSGTRVHWATKTATQFNGCTRMTANASSTFRASGTTVYQNPYPANRDRKVLIINQSVQRPSNANANQIFEFENWWIKGSHEYSDPDYMLAREGQEAFELAGIQWIKFTDCKVEEVWADAFNIHFHSSNVSGRDNDVYPGMIEILGGLIKRPGIMHMTANQFRAPDAVFPAGFWKNDPDHINVPASMNNAPSASGLQYGIWWHGNAAHPFLGLDGTHSVIDIEPQGSYCHCQDFRVGADSDKAHFQFRNDNAGDGTNPFLSAGDGNGLMFRHKFQHIYRDGECDAGWGGSAAIGYRTSAIDAASNGVALPTSTIHLNNANQDPSGAVIINVAGLGATLVRYGGESGNDLTSCTGGVGTLATGATVRGAKKNHRYFGANIAAGSNGVVLPAKGQLVNGDGVLHLTNFATTNDFPFASWLRVWAVGGPYFLQYTGDDPVNSILTGVKVFSGTGATLLTGQALTWAFVQPERAHYTVGELEVLDCEWTQKVGPHWGTNHVDGIKVTKCKGIYRLSGDVPFSSTAWLDTINGDKGGPGTFGDNTITGVP